MALTGRFLILALAFTVPVGLFPVPGAILWSLLVLLVLVLVDLALAASPRRLTLTRDLPGSVRLGEPCTAGLVLVNDAGRSLHGVVRDGWQPSAGAADALQPLTVPAGERRRLAVHLVPLRRGDLHARHVTVRSVGPLGLAARQRTIPCPGRLRVLPPFRSRRLLPSKLRRLRELDGRAAVQIRGAGTEFDSLRDYVRGDDVRSIDWRATARRQTVVVRTWRPERDRKVVIVLDTSRTSASRVEDEPRLDTGIEAALLLAALAERGGDRVTFLAFDRAVRARVESASKGSTLSRLVNAAVPLEPRLIELDWDRLPAEVEAVAGHRSLVVLLTSLDAGGAEEGLVPAAARLAGRHVVAVASVRDPLLGRLLTGPTSASDVYRAAAAERSVLERSALANALREAGAEIADAEPHQLPSDLADLYIRLKAAGRL